MNKKEEAIIYIWGILAWILNSSSILLKRVICELVSVLSYTSQTITCVNIKKIKKKCAINKEDPAWFNFWPS